MHMAEKEKAEYNERVDTVHYDRGRGQVELRKEYTNEPYLWNKDFHPTPITIRKWGPWTYLAIWFGMVTIVPTWTLSGVGLDFGLNWWQSILLMFLGNLIVLVPMLIQSHGGAKYGMSEPQLTRTRWGIYGAQIPSWIRAVISMGWWGIESYIITEAAVAMYLLSIGQIPKLLSGSTYTLSVAYPQIFWPTFIVVVLAQLLLFYGLSTLQGTAGAKVARQGGRTNSAGRVPASLLLYHEYGTLEFRPHNPDSRQGNWICILARSTWIP